MLGTVERITCDGEFVRLVELRLPQRGSLQGHLLYIRTCERIGQGSFGTVYRAVCDGYPRLALKIATGKTARLRQELEVLSKVCTKGKLLLPRFEFGAINRAGDLIAIGMELCVPSTLHDLLLVTRLSSEADMLFLAYQVLQAVASVHEQRCIHRDIKLQNFVFDLDGNLKLIDFGLASTVWNPPAGDVVAGTVSFMAPEMAHNALFRDQRVSVGASADVWSVGIVLFSIFTQRNPYPYLSSVRSYSDSEDNDDAVGGGAAVSTVLNKENVHLLRRVAAGDWRWPVGCSVSNELRQLVEFILVRDCEKRPDIMAILGKQIWNVRRRSPPAAVTAFLGVQDDFLLSHDEAHLLRAVEQRSADVTASLIGSRANSPDEECSKEATEERSSLKFVMKEETSVGGVPTHQIYDVRCEPKKKKPIREISVVMAEETAKSLRRRQTKHRRDGTLLASRSNSCTSSRVDSCAISRTTSPTVENCTGVVNGSLNQKKEQVGASADCWNTNLDDNGGVERNGGVLNEGDENNFDKRKGMKKAKKALSVDLLAMREKKCKITNKNCSSEGLAIIKGEVKGVDGSIKDTVTRTTVNTLANGFSHLCRRGIAVKESFCGQTLAASNTLPSKRIRKDVVRDSDAVRLTEAITSLIATESSIRGLAEERFFFEQESLVKFLLLMVEEAQEWCDMAWLAEEQRKSAAHPHQFKETTRVAKKYEYGFVCDMCDYEFLPEKKKLHFFHCKCGRDLCLECHETYTKQCTCAVCGNVYKNSVALRDHNLLTPCGAENVDTVRSFFSSGTQKGVKGSTAAETNTTPVKTNSCGKPAAAVTTRSTNAKGKTPSKKRATTLNSKHFQKKGTDDVTADAVVRHTAPPSLFSRPINTLPEGQWKPMERLSVSYKPIQPTMEERELLLNGDWIRHFHLFPIEEGAEPLAFTYHIQPGRTGAIFFNHSFSMHSAVISVLERQMLIVDHVDTYESKDAARVVSLGHAKCIAEDAYNLLQKVVAYDCNMIKQQRAPGTVSIYCTSHTAVRCHGDPFVYVRWFRFDAERSLSAFLLSNGSVQVLVGDQYELRWFDENRKFLLRSNGVCEMLDDSTFALAPDVVRLLYEDF